MRTDDPTAATEEKKPCDHKPDFYPSIMQWQCSVCGVPLRVSWPRLADDTKPPKAKETASLIMTEHGRHPRQDAWLDEYLPQLEDEWAAGDGRAATAEGDE